MKKKHKLLDIHRPENFKYKDRIINILKYSNELSKKYNLPIKLIGFGRTLKNIEEFNIDVTNFNVEIIELMSFKNYLNSVNESLFIISDSGTAQEEPSIFKIPVIVPRDFTERPESVEGNCSLMLDVNVYSEKNLLDVYNWIDDIVENKKIMDISWLGNGKTSDSIIDILKKILK
jgi:UDP-N-acetylglucosamine 2-epimerase (non-hydrolysing)